MQSTRRWPDATVPYLIDDESLPAECKEKIPAAMDEIMKNSCVKFIPRTTERSCVHIFVAFPFNALLIRAICHNVQIRVYISRLVGKGFRVLRRPGVHQGVDRSPRSPGRGLLQARDHRPRADACPGRAPRAKQAR